MPHATKPPKKDAQPRQFHHKMRMASQLIKQKAPEVISEATLPLLKKGCKGNTIF